MQSYQYGLAEDIKERVDAKGHVILTTDQTKLLSRTKVLCVTTVIVITNWMVMTVAVRQQIVAYIGRKCEY